MTVLTKEFKTKLELAQLHVEEDELQKQLTKTLEETYAIIDKISLVKEKITNKLKE